MILPPISLGDIYRILPQNMIDQIIHVIFIHEYHIYYNVLAYTDTGNHGLDMGFYRRGHFITEEFFNRDNHGCIEFSKLTVSDLPLYFNWHLTQHFEPVLSGKVEWIRYRGYK